MSATIRSSIFCLPVCHLKTQIKIRVAITIFVVSYRCEAWSGSLRLDHMQRVFENVELRWMSGPKEEEVTDGCKTLHNEEFFVVNA